MHIVALCGAGFRPGEHVTLAIASGAGITSPLAPATLTASSTGTFATTYAVVLTKQCPASTDVLPTLTARGNGGSTAELQLPTAQQLECAPR